MSAAATGRASGKLILLGAPAVVYGARATAARRPEGARAELRLGDRVVHPDAEADDDLAKAFAALLGEGAPAGAVLVEATTELQPGGGLGCSAALGVSIGRAVEALLSATPDDAAAVARAVAWEGVFHGNPSGIDTTAAASGGCFRYSRSEGVRPIAPAVDLWLCVGSSGPGASTRAMVDGVARLRARKPDVVDRAVLAITSLVDNAASSIEAGDLTGLGKLMDLNQMILAGLMLSTEAIETLCGAARRAGALGAKLTGAGGGGSVIALCPSARVGAERMGDEAAAEAADRVLAAWSDLGFAGFVARVRAAARPASLPRAAGGAP